ncbi:MAG: hypothetical protein D6711_18085, partial [Chloroflexi bacterium]
CPLAMRALARPRASLLTLPTQGLVSYLDTRTATQFVDSVGTSDRPVQPGRCYQFDGVDDYIRTPSPFLPTNGEDFTIESEFIHYDNGIRGTLFVSDWNPGGRISLFINSKNSAYGAGAFELFIEPDSGYTNTYTKSSTALNFAADGDHIRVNFNRTGTSYSVTIDNLTTGISDTLSASSDTPIGATYADIGNYTSNSFAAPFKLLYFKLYVANSLQLFYKCDEGAGITAYDSSGNGNHGTMYNITESTFHATDNTIGSWQNEVGYRQAMLITPTNKAWVEVQDDPSLTFTQSFRLKARFIFHSLGNYAIITKRSDYQTENAYSLLMKSDYKLAFQANIGGIWIQVLGPIGEIGKIYEAEVTYDGANIVMAINGVQYTAATTGDMYANNYTVKIGAFNDPSMPSMDGVIDYVEIGTLDTVVSRWENRGNTDADWVDLVSSNHGTVINPGELTYIPRNESVPTEDVLGNPPQYSGRV